MRPANAIPMDRILDAARELLLTIGMQRMTMADVARHADVSRATLYRRWNSVREVVAALTTREWTAVVAETTLSPGDDPVRPRLVTSVVQLVRQIRVHPLLRKIIEQDPDFLLPYLLQRRGTTTNHQLDRLEADLKAGIADGSIRPGDPAVRAKAVLLTAWSFTLTAPVLVDAPEGHGSSLDRLDGELSELLDRYLAP
ncbi:TetR family transcriptional regulator [Stackebrandtia endophytica]|uniref:TetR family transcriptional regulator n=1 Tax=Stackebrandtia endophytica TaxID=1496996 RepID=A0A543AV67_9ACTN|nr:TetR/AcrR family transcriptional regulator [Stackebrandtia endophytica]TQL76473.1 TetR family transcriptional regulator [Stackebrandtia endophytica]